MSQSTGNGSSTTNQRNGVEPNASAGTASVAEQTSSSATNGRSADQAISTAQPVQSSTSTQSIHSDSDEVRADRLLRLILAILRGGSDDSASRLVGAIRQNAREGSDEVDLRGVAESAITICRDDPGVQEELGIVEALLREFREDVIYTRFPM